MNVVKATRNFEGWLAHRTDIVKKDLRLKHVSMKDAIFPFLRATFYRWAQSGPRYVPISPRRRTCWLSAIFT